MSNKEKHLFVSLIGVLICTALCLFAKVTEDTHTICTMVGGCTMVVLINMLYAALEEHL